jgi:hypothetical protein
MGCGTSLTPGSLAGQHLGIGLVAAHTRVMSWQCPHHIGPCLCVAARCRRQSVPPLTAGRCSAWPASLWPQPCSTGATCSSPPGSSYSTCCCGPVQIQKFFCCAPALVDPCVPDAGLQGLEEQRVLSRMAGVPLLALSTGRCLPLLKHAHPARHPTSQTFIRTGCCKCSTSCQHVVQ